MGMNIKDPQVHAMARELAARRGTSVTEAVRQALGAELTRTTAPGPEDIRSTRLEAIRQIQARFSELPIRDPRSSRDLQDSLYDDRGLPI
jgi:antitoxin VapB